MSWENKVIWSEGMFLRTQHFQQQDRYTERLVQARTENLRPHGWGLSSLTIDRALLTTGRFAVAEATGVFPDGTPFKIPEEADHPLALEVPPDARNAIVYLVLPVRRSGGREFGERVSSDIITRYEGADFEAIDAVAGAESRAALRVGKLRLRFALEQEDRSGYLSLGLARIVEIRADKNVILDEGYIAPCLNCQSQPRLRGFVEELSGLLHHRGEALAGRLTQPGASGVAHVVHWLMLQTVNRYQPLFAHFAADTGQLHPEAFYVRAIEMAGELATFGNPRTRRAAEFPPYRHDALQPTFDPVMIELRQLFNAIIETNAVQIPLQQQSLGDYVAVINDRNLLTAAEFVLAVRARLPTERVLATFPRHVKIGPTAYIREMVNRALPGVPVRPLAGAPRQLPFTANTSYFELDRTGDRAAPFWEQVQRSGGLALNVPQNEFPDLQMQLWAIKG